MSGASHEHRSVVVLFIDILISIASQKYGSYLKLLEATFDELAVGLECEYPLATTGRRTSGGGLAGRHGSSCPCSAGGFSHGRGVGAEQRNAHHF